MKNCKDLHQVQAWSCNVISLLSPFCANSSIHEELNAIHLVKGTSEATNSYILAQIKFPYCAGFNLDSNEELLLYPKTARITNSTMRYPRNTDNLFNGNNKTIGTFLSVTMEDIKSATSCNFEDDYMKKCIVFSNKIAKSLKEEITLKHSNSGTVINTLEFIVGDVKNPAARCLIALKK